MERGLDSDLYHKTIFASGLHGSLPPRLLDHYSISTEPPKLLDHFVLLSNRTLPRSELITQIGDSLLVLEALRGVQLLQMSILGLQRLVCLPFHHARTSRLMRLHDELLQEEFRILLRGIHLMENARA